MLYENTNDVKFFFGKYTNVRKFQILSQSPLRICYDDVAFSNYVLQEQFGKCNDNKKCMYAMARGLC